MLVVSRVSSAPEATNLAVSLYLCSSGSDLLGMIEGPWRAPCWFKQVQASTTRVHDKDLLLGTLEINNFPN